MRSKSLLLLLAMATVLGTGGVTQAKIAPEELTSVETLLGDLDYRLDEIYYPRGRVGKDFRDRCEEVRKKVKDVEDLNEAYTLIADAVKSVDPRITFYPSLRGARADYGWQWRVVGNDAYVNQLDKLCDARDQGLKLGDKVVSIEGIPLDRGSNLQVWELFKLLTPRRALRVLVQSPGAAEPHWLAIATTLRPQRQVRVVGDPRRGAQVEWVLTAKEKEHLTEFKTLAKHQHRVGTVAIWDVKELDRLTGDVAEGLRATADASALILDLRDKYVTRDETAMRLLDGLFDHQFRAGKRGYEGLTSDLTVHGGTGSYKGTVVVLVDANTSFYAEFVARVLQQKQRAVIVGDRTAGRVFERKFYGDPHRSMPYAFEVAGIATPIGEITMADGSSLDGKGVVPDWQLLPTGADIAAQRDPVLSKVLKMLKQDVTPEDAFKMLWVDLDDDETE